MEFHNTIKFILEGLRALHANAGHFVQATQTLITKLRYLLRKYDQKTNSSPLPSILEISTVCWNLNQQVGFKRSIWSIFQAGKMAQFYHKHSKQ